MKIFNWDNDKNEKLKVERGVSFEQVVLCIENEQLLDIIEHPNKEQYKNQKMYVVEIDNYAYIVPFVDKNNERFLKTVFPSRKYTKLYLKQENKDG
ncbi:BrnT family toxin [bacterium]|nr:BrnT family toxin [bacterium]MBU1634810.1 BrnT family toxin [bacterium]MBU1872829.1 BrnT family toxin [bacterium]